jgi:hypothetical protein
MNHFVVLLQYGQETQGIQIASITAEVQTQVPHSELG